MKNSIKIFLSVFILTLSAHISFGQSYCLDIKWVADSDFYNLYGGDVQSQVSSILSDVEDIFMNNGISVNIVDAGPINIYTSSSADPYDDLSSLPCFPSDTTNPCKTVGQVLQKLIVETQSVQSDIVLLFSGQQLSNHGVAVTDQLCNSYSRAVGIAVNKSSGSTLSLTQQAAIMAHEIIHLITPLDHHNNGGLMDANTPFNTTTTIPSHFVTGIKNGLAQKNCTSCSVAASCNDGIQNQNETGIDCGGLCAPCPCPELLQLTGVIPSGLKEASNHIEASGTINASSNVTMTGGNYVEWSTGFDARSGSIVIGEVSPCMN